MLSQNFNAKGRDKLLKVMGLLASDELGERAAAAQTAAKIAGTFGGWDAILVPPVSDDLARLIRAESMAEFLSDWERSFLAGVGAILRTDGAISQKQRRTLERIVLEAQARAA